MTRTVSGFFAFRPFSISSLSLSSLSFCALLFAAGAALADDTGDVTVRGAVPVLCDILVAAEAAASGIDNIAEGASNLHIATVTENCNNPDGYTVTVQGSNSTDHTGLFVDSVSHDEHPFTIIYNGVQAPLGGIVMDSNGAGINQSHNVEITYSSDPYLAPTAGYTYEETLTFTISAK